MLASVRVLKSECQDGIEHVRALFLKLEDGRDLEEIEPGFRPQCSAACHKSTKCKVLEHNNANEQSAE